MSHQILLNGILFVGIFDIVAVVVVVTTIKIIIMGLLCRREIVTKDLMYLYIALNALD